MLFKINKDYAKLIRTIDDFPIKGVKFYDTSQIFLEPYAYNQLINDAIEILKPYKIDALAAIEARGWPFAASIANLLELPVIYVYKENKLPQPTHKAHSKSEYNERNYEISLTKNYQYKNVAIIDDILATGGTIQCVQELLIKANCHANVVFVLLKLKNFENEQKNIKLPIHSLVVK